jgi:hypothetical protein
VLTRYVPLVTAHQELPTLSQDPHFSQQTFAIPFSLFSKYVLKCFLVLQMEVALRCQSNEGIPHNEVFSNIDSVLQEKMVETSVDSGLISVPEHDSKVVIAKRSPVSRLPIQAVAVRGQLAIKTACRDRNSQKKGRVGHTAEKYPSGPEGTGNISQHHLHLFLTFKSVVHAELHRHGVKTAR